MKHVSRLREFGTITSWSTYNATTNKADIVPYFNFIVPISPFLRQNFNDFGTQMHCIEIVNSASTLLNPGQKIVDARWNYNINRK